MPQKRLPEDDSTDELVSEEINPDGHDADEDAEPIRLKAHTPIWPIAIAAAVALAAVVVILVVRPDQTATNSATTTTTTSASATTAAPTTGPRSPDPNVLWVEMPAAERAQALTLLDVWDGLDPGSVKPAPVPAGPVLESASVDTTDTLVLRGTGPALGTAPCENQQEVSVVESAAAVVVFVRSRDVAFETSGEQAVCPAVVHEILLPVPLAEPLGDRAVLSLNRWAAADNDSPLIPLAG